jgi:Tfp pilus assembly ATPase PilU
MLGTSAIRNLIRENKIAQMYSAIQTGQNLGMQTLDQNLADLVRRNLISTAEARAKAVPDQHGRGARQGQDPGELPRLDGPGGRAAPGRPAAARPRPTE